MKKVLFVATVVKTHIMEFHIPYLKMFQDMGWETAVAARNDYEDPSDCHIPHCDRYYDIAFERLPWKKANIKAYRELKAIIDREHFDIIHCHTPMGRHDSPSGGAERPEAGNESDLHRPRLPLFQGRTPDELADVLPGGMAAGAADGRPRDH